MPLLIGCLAIAFPRFALFLVWFFGGGYLGKAYEHWLWPLLGFFFLPLTTLAFAFAMNSMGAEGDVTPLGWIVIVLAGLVDLGLLRGGHSASRDSRERDG